ncbi:hypothetical protein GF351_05635, partial [Candidatus Woesearchaeota archaeon]|nr:hypothetical protein [Candidatus Woesearchaeota archaeon]
YVIPFILEPGNNVFIDYSTLPKNMSDWRGEADHFNTDGSFNMSLPAVPDPGLSYLLFFVANNTEDQPYGWFQNITLTHGDGDQTGMSVTVYPLAGESDINISQEYEDVYFDTQVLAVNFSLQNASGAAVTGSAFVEMECDNQGIGGPTFTLLRDQGQGDDASFAFPMIDSYDAEYSAKVYSPNYAPKDIYVDDDEINALAVPGDTIILNLTAFNPGGIDQSITDIFIDMIRSTPDCNVPAYNRTECSLLPAEVNLSQFNPLSVIIGGGDISFVMGIQSNRVTVMYKNADLLASGPPDVLFDSEAQQGASGAGIAEVWRFGSQGPEIYDEVLIGVPFNNTLAPNNINLTLEYLYDENWNIMWNVTANGTDPASEFSEYSDFDLSLFNGTVCNTTDTSSICYIDAQNGMLWLTIPHFSGVGPRVQGQQQSIGEANFSVVKSSEFTTYVNGTIIEFLINITNNGTANLTNVDINDTFDSSRLIYYNSTSAPTAIGQGWAYWKNFTGGGVIEQDESYELYVNFTAAAPGLANNSAFVNATDSDDDHGRAIANVTVNITMAYDDNVSPSVSLIAPDDGFNVSTSYPIFDCVATDNTNITNVSLYHNLTGDWKVNETNTSAVQGLYSFEQTFADGLYIWNCQACDNSSNCAFNDTNRTITIDTAAPIVQPEEPEEGDNVSGEINVTVQIDDNTTGVDPEEVVVTNGTGGDDLNMSLYQGDKKSGKYTALIDTTLLPDGPTNLSFEASDYAGNDNESVNVSITVDNTRPEPYLFLSPNPGTNVTGTVTVNVSVRDSTTGVQTVMLKNGTGIWVPMTLYQGSISDGNWTATIDVSGLADGAVNFTVNATDFTGNWNNTQNLTLIVDNNPPIININSPETEFNTSRPEVIVNWTAGDTVDNSLFCEVNVDGNVNGSVISPAGQWRNFTIQGLTAHSTYLWNVTCTDDTGNSNTSEARIINIDRLGPGILNVRNSSISAGKAIITWDTDEAANASVKFGSTTAMTDGSNSSALFNYSHSLWIGELASSTIYYYNVTSFDPYGNYNRNGPWVFMTQDIAAPTSNYNITNVSTAAIGEPVAAACNWTESSILIYNMTCDLWVNGIHNQTAASDGSWCNFTYIAAVLHSPTAQLVINATDNSSNIGQCELQDITITSDVNLSLETYQYLNSSDQNADNFSYSTLQQVETLMLNFSVNTTGSIDSWYLNFTANGTNACSLGNLQSSACYNLGGANEWVVFDPNQTTATFNSSGGAAGDNIEVVERGSGSSRIISLRIDEHYNPNVFKHYNAIYDFSDVKWQDGADQQIRENQMIKVELNNTIIPLDADRYKLDFRVDYSLIAPTVALQAYLCNSSYTTGDPEALDVCAFVASKLPGELQDDGTKYRGIFGKALIHQIGDIKYAVLRSDESAGGSYYKLKTYKAKASGYVTQWNYSTDSGAIWQNLGDGYESELNINWFYVADDVTQFVYSFYANSTTGDSQSLFGTLEFYPDYSANTKPIVNLISPSTNTTVSNPFSINWDSADSEGDKLNTSLYLYQGGAAVETIITGLPATQEAYTWSASDLTGNFNLTVIGCETNATNATTGILCGNDSHRITLDNLGPNVTSPAVSSDYAASGTPIDINVSVNDISAVSVVTVSGGTAVVMNNTLGGYIYNTTATPAALGCAADAVCVLTFNATDEHGNINSSVTTNITVDDSAPSAVLAGANETDVVFGRDLSIYTNWSDASLASRNLTCVLYVNGTLNQTINSSESWCNFTYTTGQADYPQGLSFVVNATDDLGNIGVSSAVAQNIIVGCGVTLTENITLNSDVDCTSGGDGLTVNSNLLTVDCAGYTLTGSGTGTGVVMSSNSGYLHTCTIENFDKGVHVSGSSNNISSCTLTNNTVGIQLDADGNNIQDNDISSSTRAINGTGATTWLLTDTNTLTENNAHYRGVFKFNSGSLELDTSYIYLNGSLINRTNVTMMSLDAGSLTTAPNTQAQYRANGAVNLTVLLGTTTPLFIAVAEETSTSPPATAIEVRDIIINHSLAAGDWIIIRMMYNDSELGSVTESSLKMYSYDDTLGTWSQVANQSINTTANYVWGNVSSLSLFGIFGSTPGGTTGGGGGGGGGSYNDYYISDAVRTATVSGMDNYDRVWVTVNNVEYLIKLTKTGSSYVDFDVAGTDVRIDESSAKDFDLNGDGVGDVRIIVGDIGIGKPDVTFKMIDGGKIPLAPPRIITPEEEAEEEPELNLTRKEPEPAPEPAPAAPEPEPTAEERPPWAAWAIGIGLLVIIAGMIAGAVYYRKKDHKKLKFK